MTSYTVICTPSELEGVFNAIAALTASADFTGLLRLLALVAIISLVLAVLSGRARHEDFWRWVIMLALVNGMLLVPKSTVILVDRTSTQPTRVVANVPIGLAALAHGTSKIGDWLTRAYETVFALPDDLQFQKRGLMFGHRVLTETQSLNPDHVSGAWMRDFQEFWRECVTPDLISGYLPVDALRTSTDLWATLGNTNPALYVTLSTIGTVPCHPNAYNDLTNRLNSEVVPNLIKKYADMSFPGDPLSQTNIQNGIVAAYAHGLNINNTAHAIVKQAAMQNATIQAYCDTFAQAGDSNRAALCYASSMGAKQTNFTYQVLGKIAESSMPKLKSAIEMIQYAVFPIILAFAIVAGHLGLPVLKTYVMSLVWVQLWPPLYAVIHYIQTMKMQAYADQLGPMAGTLSGQATLVNMGISDQAVAGMLVMAIPPIAAALVKGGEVGLQAVAGLVSAPRTAERQAADIVKGNESVGQWKTSPIVDYAASPTPVMARRNDDGSYTYTHPDGGVTYNVGTAMDRASARASTAGRVSVGASMVSESAETTAQSQMIAAGQTFAAGLQQSADFVRTHARGERAGTHYGLGDQTGFSQAVNQAQEIVDSFAKKHGLNQSQSAQILGMAEASIRNPKALDLISPLSVGAIAQATGRSEASAKQLLEDARAYAKETGFSETVDKIRRATREDTFDTSDEASRRAMEGIRANFDQSIRYLDQASANYQKSLSFKELAQQAKDGSVTVDQDLTTLVMNRFATERFQTSDGVIHDGMAKDELDYYMRVKNDPIVRRMFERFANEATAQYLEETYGGKMPGRDEVRAFFERGKAVVPGTSYVAEQGKQWLDEAKDAAAQTGVDPREGVSSRLPQQIAATQRQDEQAIEAGRGQVQTEGEPLKDKVINQTAPGTQPLLGQAATNAVAQILPDGASRAIMKKLPGVNMSVGTPGSAVAEAAAARAERGQPRDPVLNSLRNVGDAATGALDGAWNQGEKAAGDLFSGSPGGSNLGSLLGGGQRPVPAQAQPIEGESGQQKGDAPPPSNR